MKLRKFNNNRYRYDDVYFIHNNYTNDNNVHNDHDHNHNHNNNNNYYYT